MKQHPGTVDSAWGAVGAHVVTVSDSTDDPYGPFLGIWVGAAGAVKVMMANQDIVTFPSVPAGSLLPIAVCRVYSTGTTVPTPNTNIIGLK